MMSQLIASVQALVQEYDMLPENAPILCAVSGGADSMCLLHLLKTWESSISLVVVHYNHRLRGAASDADEAFVASVCAQWEIPFRAGRGDVAAAARKQGRGVEETARSMRYAFFETVAAETGAARIATAHTADDNVETILMHLVRGSGLSGLCGIPPRRGAIVRPLLHLGRRDVLAYLTKYGIPHREDESNRDLTYTRNRLRHAVVPVLQAINPNLHRTVTAASRSLRQDHDYLNAASARHRELIQPAEENRVISRRALLRLPPAIASRLLQTALEEVGVSRSSVSAHHIAAIFNLAQNGSPSGRITLPQGAMVQRVYEELLLTKTSEVSDTFDPLPLPSEGCVSLPHVPWQITVTPCTAPDAPPSGTLFFLNATKAANAFLEIRPRKTGDSIRPLRRTETKVLKEWMINAKIPRHLRDLIPVIASDTEVAAVAGLGPAEQWAAPPGEAAWKIEIEGITI